jgi:uncharacterized protein YdaU (DUF1376 family)
MAEFPGFTLWTDAYLGDTGHLSTLEHGAYLLLLITMWRSGGSLPNDDRKLAKCARLTPSQWGRIRDTMMDFFTVEDGRVTQGRLTDELTFVKQRSARQSENARAKSRKTKKSPPATAKPNASQTPAPTLTPTLTEDTSLRSVAATPRRTKGTRLDGAWLLPSKWGEWAMAEFPHLTRDAIRREAEGFRDYWISKPDHATKLDWEATWRNWIRRAATQSQPRGSPRQSNRPPTMLELNTQLLAEMENADARRQEDHGQLEPPAGNLPAVWER